MKDDPRYARYFKMVQIGVPMAQVKQKMMMEGVNPDILDNPDALADAVKDTPAPATADDSSDEESSDSFS
jgi:WASH complex subunit CCDC53